MSETLKPHCHHDTVRRQIEDHGDRTDKWKCACGEEFYRLDLQPGKVKLLQPAAPTLRDQFAMAAMISDSIQSAILVAAHMAQGQSYQGEYPGLESGVEEHYKTADAMMKARENDDKNTSI